MISEALRRRRRACARPGSEREERLEVEGTHRVERELSATLGAEAADATLLVRLLGGGDARRAGDSHESAVVRGGFGLIARSPAAGGIEPPRDG